MFLPYIYIFDLERKRLLDFSSLFFIIGLKGSGSMKIGKKLLTYLVIVVMALAGALNYQLFVFPNQFAPAGVGGICTMIQYLFGINVGYLNLIINIPLAFLVLWRVGRSLAVRSMLYVLCFSGFLILFESMNFSRFAYETESTSKILAPMAAGVVNGAVYSILVRSGATSGGMDLAAALIHRKRPEQNFFWIVFGLNTAVAAASYVVYGFQPEPVLLCILYCFLTSTVSDRMMKSSSGAVRCEIVTDDPETISERIIKELHHTATLLPAKGMYSGADTHILICIINKSQRAIIADMVEQYPRTFAVFSDVSRVVGNFKQIGADGSRRTALLDRGSHRL